MPLPCQRKTTNQGGRGYQIRSQTIASFQSAAHVTLGGGVTHSKGSAIHPFLYACPHRCPWFVNVSEWLVSNQFFSVELPWCLQSHDDRVNYLVLKYYNKVFGEGIFAFSLHWFCLISLILHVCGITWFNRCCALLNRTMILPHILPSEIALIWCKKLNGDAVNSPGSDCSVQCECEPAGSFLEQSRSSVLWACPKSGPNTELCGTPQRACLLETCSSRLTS